MAVAKSIDKTSGRSPRKSDPQAHAHFKTSKEFKKALKLIKFKEE